MPASTSTSHSEAGSDSLTKTEMASRSENILWSLVLSLLILGGASGVLAWMWDRAEPEKREELPPPAPAVRTLRVKTERVSLRVTSQGRVRPRTRTQLVARVPGQIMRLSESMANGAFFKSGDVLMEIDDSDLVVAVARAKARLATTKRALAFEENEAKVAVEEWKRRFSTAPDPLAAHIPQLAEARANVAAAEAELEKAELDLTRAKITAPYDGRVSRRSVDLGQYVMPGTPLADIHAIDYVEVRLPILDASLALLDLPRDFGASNNLTLACDVLLSADFAGEHRSWHGTVVRVEGEIDARTHMVYLVAEVKDPYGVKAASDRVPLPVGLFVDAEIIGRDRQGVIILPNAALLPGDRVRVVTPENRLVERGVEILQKRRDTVLVASGLSSGERVCLTPIETFVPDMKVRPLDTRDER